MAVEMRIPDVAFTFAASSHGSVLMVFDSHAQREEAIHASPIHFAGIDIAFVRPEDTDDRSSTDYDLLVEIEASNFPLELWSVPGATFIFGHVGRLCWVDPACFRGHDYSSMRAFVQIEAAVLVTPTLVLRLPDGGIICVRLRNIAGWCVAPGHPSDFSGGAPPSSPRGGASGPRHGFGSIGQGMLSSLDDINDEAPQVVPDIGSASNGGTAGRASRLQELNLLSDVAHGKAAAVAKAVVVDAQELMDSMRALNPDAAFVFCASGGPLLPVDHVNEARKRRVRTKRAHDSAAKLHRSHRLAAKEEASFLSIVDKSICAKAASFDLSAATNGPADALRGTGLTSNPEVPCCDHAALASVARACGADEGDLGAIRGAVVLPSSP
uniref:Uncharacterized protein n=1 Tax=Avena sativa TaxID=4498 RepID=A0ACD5UPY0_AVESA